MIGKKVNLDVIPVQYVMNELTPRKESEFLIKDNLLRRHLTPQDRLKLYCKLYKNFEERILKENRGGDRKSDQAKIKSEISPLITEDENNVPITASMISNDTGENINVVKKDLESEKKKNQR